MGLLADCVNFLAQTCVLCFQVSTLRFATRMMCVANEPAINEVYDPAVSYLFDDQTSKQTISIKNMARPKKEKKKKEKRKKRKSCVCSPNTLYIFSPQDKKKCVQDLQYLFLKANIMTDLHLKVFVSGAKL